MVIMQVVEWS